MSTPSESVSTPTGLSRWCVVQRWLWFVQSVANLSALLSCCPLPAAHYEHSTRPAPSTSTAQLSSDTATQQCTDTPSSSGSALRSQAAAPCLVLCTLFQPPGPAAAHWHTRPGLSSLERVLCCAVIAGRHATVPTIERAAARTITQQLALPSSHLSSSNNPLLHRLILVSSPLLSPPHALPPSVCSR